MKKQQLEQEIKEYNTKINNMEQQIQALEQEKYRLEGERRYIIRQGQEDGLIDQQGRYIQQQQKVNKPELVKKKD